MSSNEKGTLNVPERRISVGGERKEKEETKSADNNAPVVDKGQSSRSDILAKAREAKRRKKLAIVINETENVANSNAASKPDVVNNTSNDDNNVDSADTDDDDDDTVMLPLPSKHRKRLLRAILGPAKKEDSTEEPPRKKSKTTNETAGTGVVGTFILDKTIDLVRLAAASGVASIGFVLLKSLAGGQVTPAEKTVADISSDWVKQ
jgi:hypothetical protein